jgi:bacterioferritin (cytochrome b1)
MIRANCLKMRESAMPGPNLESDIARHLNSVLRLQLTAVQQHFIHVLILKAWGDEETAAGITAIDNVDLPNAMRIVDFIVSGGALPRLSVDQRSLAEHMPTPGSSYERIFAAERRLERRLIDVLQVGERAVATLGSQEVVHLILDPLSARDSYEQWIQEQIAAGPRTSEPVEQLSTDAMASLDTLFAYLMVVIEQGLVHSFVHWHSGQKKLADFAWQMSGAAMMQATEITKFLALRHSAPAPAEAVVPNSVPWPRIGGTWEEALMLDRALAERCRAAAERAEEDLSETEFGSVCRDSAAYFHALINWQPKFEQPEFNNPCRDFERVLREYVWQESGAGHASA